MPISCQRSRAIATQAIFCYYSSPLRSLVPYRYNCLAYGRQSTLQTNSLVTLNCSSQLLFCLKTNRNTSFKLSKTAAYLATPLGRYRHKKGFYFHLKRKPFLLTCPTGSYFATPSTASALSSLWLRPVIVLKRRKGLKHFVSLLAAGLLFQKRSIDDINCLIDNSRFVNRSLLKYNN